MTSTTGANYYRDEHNKKHPLKELDDFERDDLRASVPRAIRIGTVASKMYTNGNAIELRWVLRGSAETGGKLVDRYVFNCPNESNERYALQTINNINFTVDLINRYASITGYEKGLGRQLVKDFKTFNGGALHFNDKVTLVIVDVNEKSFHCDNDKLD